MAQTLTRRGLITTDTSAIEPPGGTKQHGATSVCACVYQSETGGTRRRERTEKERGNVKTLGYHTATSVCSVESWECNVLQSPLFFPAFHLLMTSRWQRLLQEDNSCGLKKWNEGKSTWFSFLLFHFKSSSPWSDVKPFLLIEEKWCVHFSFRRLQEKSFHCKAAASLCQDTCGHDDTPHYFPRCSH